MILFASLVNFKPFSNDFFKPSYKNHSKSVYKIAFIIFIPVFLGVLLRIKANYHALDFVFSGLFTIGLISGIGPALIFSTIVSLFLLLVGEYFGSISCLLFALSGFLFFKEDIFSSNKKIYKISFTVIPLTFINILFFHYFGKIFVLSNDSFLGNFSALVGEFLTIFIILFMFRHHKTKLDLQTNLNSLNEAKLAVLSSKINPHFLFNTLNTIASAIRISPTIARDLVFKLSEIMRYVLNTENEFKPLKDEMDFINNYLLIEKVRFGDSRLSIEMDIDPKTLEVNIPTMIIQPIVENAIKHGVAPLSEKKGNIKIRTVFFNDGEKDLILIEITDNGTGMEMHEEAIYNKGIGLANVRDRLKLLYGEKSKLMFSSVVGDGTIVSLVLPVWR